MRTIRIVAALFLMTNIIACTDDDDNSVTPAAQVTPNEEELITTVNLTFKDTSSMTMDSLSFGFSDIDGPGGNAPTIDTIRLAAGKVYNLAIQFLDESDPMDVENITMEIEEEDDEHLVCFEPTGVSGLVIDKTDSDGTYEVGLASQWSVSGIATSTNGEITLTLRHQPGSKDGTCIPGDTDVEVDFPIIIE